MSHKLSTDQACHLQTNKLNGLFYDIQTELMAQTLSVLKFGFCTATYTNNAQNKR